MIDRDVCGKAITLKKNIWIFHHYSTPPSMSGLARPYHFARRLEDYGYTSTVFSSAFLHFSGENLIKKKERYISHIEDGVEFIFVKTTEYKGNKADRILNMISFMVNLFRVRKTMEKNNGSPRLIVASSPHLLTLFAGIYIARKYKVPCIFEIRDLWPEAVFMLTGRSEKSFIGRILVSFEYWLYRRADGFVFTKEGDVDYIKEHKWDTAQGGAIDLIKCHYINNGVDTEGFKESVSNNVFKDPDLDTDTFKVVYAGTIRLVNNVENIVDAAKILRDYKDIMFLIYGEGSEVEKISERIEKEELGNVRLKGYISRRFIPYVLSKSSLNILNYSADKYNWARGNSSNKLFEYMASGKPVVSNVKMGYCIIDRYNCGISLEDSSPEALAETILSVRNMSKAEYNELCENAAEGAKDFDFHVLAKKLAAVINDMIGED